MDLDRTDDRRKLFAVAGGIALLAGVGGLLIGRTMAEPTAAEPAAEAGEHGEEEENGPEGFVAVAAENVASIGIKTEKVAAGALGSEILAQATATAPPQGRSSATARADGALTSISKRLGDAVGAGETIALLESREASAIMAERASAAARAQAATSALNRERRLFEENITARQDLEAAQAEAAQAQAELRRTEAAVRAAGVTSDGRHIAVRSLISGRITKMDAELGAFVSAGTELFEIANPRSVQIEAAVPWADAQRVRPGDPAVIELGGGETLQASVRSTTPSLDPESRAATVVLSPAGVPAGLTQGQAFRVRITPRGSATDSRIVLPEGAVQSVEGRDVVFVQVRGGFQATPVTAGGRSGGRIEILEGLKPGAVVATEGAFVLKSQLGASEAEH
ncbi:MAG: efflux transporter periplasmic adaptor subunit [Sphingomonadales bacterium 32-68-7]|nr:MAG: efflux transporter periplasmic adaptor subunit [Sphingomonadales bacterium 12-68-11]OYX10081.1 MAG: efflux transporter periplasmic adaptor subunit [Sphingomonadales bacterium 32-68-7]